MKTVEYKILQDLQINIEYYSGYIETQDIVGLKEREVLDSKFVSTYNYIVFVQDMKDVKLKPMDIEEGIAKYISYIDNKSIVLGKRKTAIVCATPNQVALATLYIDAASKLPMEFKIVSTLDTAFEWVDLAEDKRDELIILLKHFRDENN